MGRFENWNIHFDNGVPSSKSKDKYHGFQVARFLSILSTIGFQMADIRLQKEEDPNTTQEENLLYAHDIH